MTNKPKSRRIADTQEHWRTIHEAGGLDHRQIRNFSVPALAPPEGKEDKVWYPDLAAAIYGRSPEELAAALEYEERLLLERRPHVFAVKRRFRSGRSSPLSPETRLIGAAEFAEIYSAAAYSEYCELWFDCTITLSWRKLGNEVEANAQEHFLAFTKCVRAWLSRYRIPFAAIYCHESGPDLGLHTHLAMHVPDGYRDEFKAWARAWPRRQLGRQAPGAIRVRGPRKSTDWLHWVVTSYLLKGYDLDEVVVAARNAPDRKEIYLGELIPSRWRNPGPVALHRRVGSSRYLGPGARALNDPIGLRKSVFGVAEIFPKVRVSAKPLATPRHLRRPFRSKYEDGVRDIRLLYPKAFLEWYYGQAPTRP